MRRSVMTNRREEISNFVNQLNKIWSSENIEFMYLFELSGLPNDYFKNKTLEYLDLSNSDLRDLDLSGTKVINCNIDGTIFPKDFDVLNQVVQEVININGSSQFKYEFEQDFEDFMHAAMVGDKVLLLSSIQKGVDINRPDEDGCTAIIYASKNGYMHLCELLVSKEVDVNSRDKHKRTPLIHASIQGHFDVAELLLEKKAEIDAKDIFSKDAMDYAKDSGDYGLIRLFETMVKSKIKDEEHLDFV